MNAVIEQQPVSAQTLEHVLGTGDLAKLTTGQRIEYYSRTCQTLGLNPLTRPFRFLALNGQIQLYATRDCTDQLRKLHGINLQIADKRIDGDLFIVTVRAKTKDGREDEDLGAVTLGQLKGDSRANAIMKAMTKAKRRVTLSICGLGLLSEDELDTVPGARTFDAEERPPAEIRTEREAINAATPMPEPPQPEKRSWAQWADSLEMAVRDAGSNEELGRLLARAEVGEIKRLASEGAGSPAKTRILRAIEDAERRYLADPPDVEEDAPEIKGEEKMLAGD
jgi:hypothetical protein